MEHEINTNGSRSRGGIIIRRLDAAGSEALRRLAQLDSAPQPQGRWLGLEIEGRLLVATSLDGTGTIADPFSRTEDLRALLELRADQLRRRRSGRFHARGSDRRLASHTASAHAGHTRPLTLPARQF